MRKVCCFLMFYVFFVGVAYAESLLDVRFGIETKLVNKVSDSEALPIPPKKLLSLVKYQTKLGDMSAYVSEPPSKSNKYPAIIWITGGFPAGGIGDSAWKKRPKTNDQSAKIYRESGVIMMYPSFRGTNGNPGFQEGFYGEVNDVISALEYIKKLDYVDSENIYLGGHSTGGTLALLVAESTDDFRAIFAFGPVAAPIHYGESYALHDPDMALENKIRAPVYFLDYINSPTYIIEGSNGNIDSLQELRSINKNANVRFIEIKNSDHFELLYPVNKYIASQLSSNLESAMVLTRYSFQKAFNLAYGL